MTNKTISKLSLVIFLAFVLSACTPKSDNTSQVEANPEVAQITSESKMASNTSKGKWFDIVGKKSATCTFTTTYNEIQTTGQVKSDTNRFVGQFTITDPESPAPMVVNSLYDGEYLYSWGDQMPQAIKMKFNPEESMEQSEKMNTENSGPNFDMDYDFDCKDWNVDESSFALPEGVVFTDYSAQMLQVQEQLKDMGGNQCQACEALSGDQQAQCKQMLGC